MSGECPWSVTANFFYKKTGLLQRQTLTCILPVDYKEQILMRERDRQTDRQTETDKQRERERQRERQRETERDRERQRERERERERAFFLS